MTNTADVLYAFRQAALERGILLPDQIRTNGRINRCGTVAKPKGLDGAYLLHLDASPTGLLQNHAAGESEMTPWKMSGHAKVSASQIAQWKASNEAKNKALALETAQAHAVAAVSAMERWSMATPAPRNHPYLVKKDVGPHGLRLERGSLLVPIHAADGSLVSLQTISGAGEKMLLKGGRKAGCFSVIGDQMTPDLILVVEGWATGATVFEATGHMVVVAIDAGNLMSVGLALEKAYPGAELLFCADDDHLNPHGNVGWNKAKLAAEEVDAWAVSPEFPEPRAKNWSDWNDLVSIPGQGLAAVKMQLESFIAGLPDKGNPPPGSEPGAGRAGNQPAEQRETETTNSKEQNTMETTDDQYSEEEIIEDSRDAEDPNIDETDLGNGRLFAQRWHDEARYTPGLGWLCWDGTVWHPDRIGRVNQMVDELTIEMRDTAIEELGEANAAKAVAETANAAESGSVDMGPILARVRRAKFDLAQAKSSRSHSRAASMLLEARTQAAVVVPIEAWDSHSFLFAVANGVVDLRSGDLLPAKREYLITKKSPIVFDPKAKAPRWERFLGEVFDDDQALVQFVQSAVGYSMTAETKEDCLFFAFGNGCNGKSVFTGVMRDIFGDTFATTAAATFTKDKHAGKSAIRSDLMCLRGARFSLTSELDTGTMLDEGILKSWTGRGLITARELYQPTTTFKPIAKLWWESNHLPSITNVDDGIWRRIKLVPFQVSFEGRKDMELSDKLTSELPGILNWAIQGCINWQDHRLPKCDAVDAATKEYREDSDVISSFFAETCIKGFGERCSREQMAQVYSSWCMHRGERPMASKLFTAAVRRAGGRDTKVRALGKVKDGWAGIAPRDMTGDGRNGQADLLD